MKLDLINDKIERIFPRYLIANIIGSVLISLNYFIDTICVGQSIGELGLASLNVAVPVTGLLYALGYLFGHGGANRYSGYLGEQKPEQARRVYAAALLGCLVLSLFIAAVGLVFLDPVSTFLGAIGRYRQGTIDYLVYVFAFAPFYMLNTFFTAFVTNDKAPRISMIGNGVGVILNIILDVLFVTVFGWGLWGASLASGIGVSVGAVILFGGTFRKTSGLHIWECKPDMRELPAAIRVGASSCLRELTGSLLILVINMILVTLPNAGEMAVAAYGVVANFGTIILCTLSGVSNTIQPLVSINAGAGKNRRVRRILVMGIVWSLGLMGLYVLLGELWPGLLISVFVDSSDAAFLSMSTAGIRLVFPCYLVAGVTIALNVYFEAVQATSEAFWLSLLRGLLIPVLAVFVCAFFLGVQGVWVSFLVSECLCGLIAVLMLRRVSAHLAAWNLDQLDYYDSDGVDNPIEEVFRRIGADELSSFKERIMRCREENPEEIGIPLYVGLEDFDLRDEEPCETAEADPSMGLLLAVGAILYTNLYEQEEDAGQNDPPIVRAMHVLASHCFLSEQPEDSEEEALLHSHSDLIRMAAAEINAAREVAIYE